MADIVNTITDSFLKIWRFLLSYPREMAFVVFFPLAFIPIRILYTSIKGGRSDTKL